MKKLVMMALCLLFIGCATSQVPYNQSTLVNGIDRPLQENESKVIFIRDTGFMGSAVDKKIYVNEIEVCSLWPGESCVIYLEEGDYIFKSIFTGLPNANVSYTDAVIDAGYTYIYRIGFNGNNTYIARISKVKK